MLEYISLGSNCSISYQLNKYNLRKNAYPFDWCKININQLINILENNFDNFIDTIEYQKDSLNHLYINKNNDITNKGSIVVKNYYSIKFSHELLKKEDINEFKNKLLRRIKKFINIKDLSSKIIFLWIEIKPINNNWENKILRLLELLNLFSSDYILKLIINSTKQFINFPEYVQIYRYNEFNSDWKMDSLNWKIILNYKYEL